MHLFHQQVRLSGKTQSLLRLSLLGVTTLDQNTTWLVPHGLGVHGRNAALDDPPTRTAARRRLPSKEGRVHRGLFGTHKNATINDRWVLSALKLRELGHAGNAELFDAAIKGLHYLSRDEPACELLVGLSPRETPSERHPRLLPRSRHDTRLKAAMLTHHKHQTPAELRGTRSTRAHTAHLTDAPDMVGGQPQRARFGAPDAA
eukprot:15449846-Alexandrium_andersonii.AAC.2